MTTEPGNPIDPIASDQADLIAHDGGAAFPPPPSEDRAGERMRVGLVLILIAAAFGLVQTFHVDWLAQAIVLILGLIFYASGAVRRNPGGLIAGGILTGIGLGIVFTSSNALPGDAGGAAFMLSFALGWALITIGTAVFTDDTLWWPLIPGGIMALIGLAAAGLTLSQRLLSWLGDLWWVVLLAVGIYLVVTRDRPTHRL